MDPVDFLGAALSPDLLLAVCAVMATAALLIGWMRNLVAGVPLENREYLDPPPAYWRHVRWLARPVAAWVRPFLPRSVRKRLVERLRQAGLEYALTVDQFVAGQLIAAAATVALVIAVTWPMGLPRPWGLLVGALVGGFLPLSWLRDRIATRSRRIAKALPFYLDVITLAIEAGCNMTGALQHAADKGPRGPMSEELNRVLRDVRAGSHPWRGLADAGGSPEDAGDHPLDRLRC
jgi:tight adherence protein C